MSQAPDRHGLWLVLLLFVLASIGTGYVLGWAITLVWWALT